MAIRLYQAADRTEALALIKKPQAIDAANTEVHVAVEGGKIVGTAVGLTLDNETWMLGSILLEDAGRHDLFHALLLAQLEYAEAAGYEWIDTSTTSARLMNWVRSTYPPGSGTSVSEAKGNPPRWRFRVRIADILPLLRGAS